MPTEFTSAKTTAPLPIAREQLSAGKIVGRSTHSPEQASAALAEGADYIGFGPLFPTPTKKDRPGIGLENIPAVMTAVGSPKSPSSASAASSATTSPSSKTPAPNASSSSPTSCLPTTSLRPQKKW